MSDCDADVVPRSALAEANVEHSREVGALLREIRRLRKAVVQHRNYCDGCDDVFMHAPPWTGNDLMDVIPDRSEQ